MNNIVRETASEIRAMSRIKLKGNWVMVFLGCLLFYVLSSTVPLALDGFFPPNSVYNEAMDVTITVGGISGIYSVVLTGAFQVGLGAFMLAFFRRNEINLGYIFSGFEYFLKTLGLFLVMSLFIALWSLLLVIPGIIAALRYSQAFYILADEPSKGVMQCIKESKEMMIGNKMKLFTLGVSFIGWLLVALAVTFLISSGITLVFSSFVNFEENGVAYAVLQFFTSLPSLVVAAYLKTSMTAFYDLASGVLIAEPKNDPIWD